MARLRRRHAGAGGEQIFDLLSRAAANAVEATRLLCELLDSWPDGGPLAQEIVRCEQEGDHVTHAIIAALGRGPLDAVRRQDARALASALDDVVDYTEEVADCLGVYKIEAPMEQAQALAGLLGAATRQIAAAIPLARAGADVGPHTREANRLENEGDRVVRDALGALFVGGVDPLTVIRWKDIFERLENAIDSTERAAWLLEAIAARDG